MDLRLTFNEVVTAYDRWRPTYVAALYADLFRYAGIAPQSRALEVGIGTGQATLPVLRTGCGLTAVELGDKLAAHTRQKFRGHPNFTVETIAFEAYECPDNTFDMIYSASAFHWIPEEIGYPKVYRLLKKGGTFARFANHPSIDKKNEPLHAAIREAYARHMPGAAPKPAFDEKMAKSKAALSGKYGFTDARYKLYYRTRHMDAEGYGALIGTFSHHRALGPRRLSLLICDIREAIHRFGGVVCINDTIDLQLARKP